MAGAKKKDETAKKSQKKDSKEESATPEEIAKTQKVATKPGNTQTGSAQPAKAGKRSPKAIKTSEYKAAKEERKKVAVKGIEAEKSKVEQKPPRSRPERAGKKYHEAYKQIDRGKAYNLAEAVELAAATSPSKFDATVEMHINLAVDPKQADQNVRDAVVMPHGIGKTIKVAVFVEGDEIEKAKMVGADIAGTDQIIIDLDKEQINFDVLISTPSLMGQLGKYAKLLGPKGLMPNPKSGTVTINISKAVKDAKAGRVEYRVDQAGIIHLGIGKVSFGSQKLLENAQSIVSSIRSAKPASVKGAYIKSAYVSSTMGPSVKTEL